MQGVLNVREPMVVNGVTVPGATGNGCADDTDAIQARLDQLVRAYSPSTKCLATGGRAWPEYAAAVYFPPGVYRITAPLRMPVAYGWRLFGESGRGSQFAGDPAFPVGTIIQQSTPGEPILVLGNIDQASPLFQAGWDIEGLGFTWTQQQEPPQNWTYRLADDPTLPGYTDPGAVAILFTGPRGTVGGVPTDFYAEHYHGQIARCTFSKGWRGIAIDDTHEAVLSAWDVLVEACWFSSFRGAAISYVKGPGLTGGMPNNAIVSTFVENYERGDGVDHRNVEEQIRLQGQSGMRLSSMDLEGSKTSVLYADSSVLSVDGLHIEHVDIEAQYGQMVFLCCGRYAFRGAEIDGVMKAQDPVSGATGLSVLFAALGDTAVTLEAVRALPHDPAIPDPGEIGFIPLAGPAYLFQGAADANGRTPTLHLLDRPQLPVYNKLARETWAGKAQHGEYEPLWTYGSGVVFYPGGPTAPQVRMPEAKAQATVTLPSVAAGTVQTLTVPVAGAKPGDVVRMGLPASFPVSLMVTPVAVNNEVQLRLANPTAVAFAGGASVVVVLSVGGGPFAGEPQPV